MKKILVIACSIILSSCSNNKSEANDKKDLHDPTPIVNKSTPVPTSIMNMSASKEKKEFEPSFIAAADLLKKIKDKQVSYVFDVRNKESYDESHIATALNKPLPITAESVKGIPKDAHIVTYCGCPHHLSSIGAEELTNLGYKDVHVLNEGFWYWRDHKFPMVVDTSSKSKITEIGVEGFLNQQNKPLANKDIYLKHELSGQLEATRTDANGAYKMHFHLYNYRDNDKFKFYVGDLKTPVQEFVTNKKENPNVIVNMP